VRLPRLLVGGAVVAVVAATAACGAQALEPKIALRDALSDFAAGRTGALELSVASSADEVRAFAEAADPAAAASGGDMSDDDLETLLSSSVDVGYDLGEDRESDADDENRVVVHVGDLDAAELRTVEGLLYARADLDGLAEQFPEMQQGLDEFRAGLSGADGVSEQAPPEVVEPATALLDGEWVSVDIQAYLGQLEAATAGASGSDPAPSLSDYASAEGRDLLGAALEDAVTSVERREGDGELGDHLVAHLDLRKGYTTLRAGLPDLFDGELAASLEDEMPPVGEVPDKQVDVSFWVLDGALSRVELDLAQFLDEPAGHLVLRADTLPDMDITAPSDAVVFDLEALGAGLAGAMSGEAQFAAPGQVELSAYDIATWVDGDISAAAYDDGGVSSAGYLPDVLPYYDGLAPGLLITAVGERIQVALDQDVVCLTLSADGAGGDIAEGPC
jgi:hypothetical protein